MPRCENMHDGRRLLRHCLASIYQYCASFPQVFDALAYCRVGAERLGTRPTQPARRFAEFCDGAAHLDRVEHTTARIEAGPHGR